MVGEFITKQFDLVSTLFVWLAKQKKHKIDSCQLQAIVHYRTWAHRHNNNPIHKWREHMIHRHEYADSLVTGSH